MLTEKLCISELYDYYTLNMFSICHKFSNSSNESLFKNTENLVDFHIHGLTACLKSYIHSYHFVVTWPLMALEVKPVKASSSEVIKSTRNVSPGHQKWQ